MTKICIVAAVAAALAVIAPASAFAAGWFQMMPVISEANGFVASILVLTTFTMTDMPTTKLCSAELPSSMTIQLVEQKRRLAT
jgi:hypothetical protein